ncbi:MAG: DUF1003 domain-containing protein [Vulcanimicrobiaceae bacterium]
MHSSSSVADDAADLPLHVESSVRSIVDFNQQHVRRATRWQRGAERLISAVGREGFAAGAVGLVALWASYNALAPRLHLPVFDAPPYYWLQGIVSLTALCVTVLVLATQRRLDRLAEERAQLTLQVALVGEQKTTKIIALLEELRSDHPNIANRHDAQAVAMSEPTDPQTVLDALRESSEQLGDVEIETAR